MLSIAVAGMWHLGSVTAACLASAGHKVIGIDEDPEVVAALTKGQPPVAEPGLSQLITDQTVCRLSFTTRFEEAATADVVWIAYDTPIDSNDNADTQFIIDRALRLLGHMKNGAILVVSSQMPVGSVAHLEREFEVTADGREIEFACVPENLRLGKAIDVFLRPDRVVIGLRRQRGRELMEAVYRPFTDRLEWMSIESAEMTKHAINAFLATSVCFINEIAAVCETVGADALDVERGLKTDRRIGPRAYLHAGSAFAGGTLARDIVFLRSLATAHATTLPLIDGVYASNEQQKSWLKRCMKNATGSVAGRTIAILGLTYKPGTSTLRRSAAVEAAQWLSSQGAIVHAYDPEVRVLPAELQSIMSLSDTPANLLRDADALVVMTPWPEFQHLEPQHLPPLVFDPGRFLERIFSGRDGVRYFTIGRTA